MGHVDETEVPGVEHLVWLRVGWFLSEPAHHVAGVVISSESRSSANQERTEVLKSDMEAEIADQTFRFTSDELARILSPKKPKDGVDFSKLPNGG